MLTACEPDQVNEINLEQNESIKDPTDHEQYKNIVVNYLNTHSIGHDQVEQPLVFDITNDGNDDIILYNAVQPTDYDQPTSYIAIYNQEGKELAAVEMDFIASIEGIQNATFGNVLFLYSPATNGIAKGYIYAYDNQNLIEIAALDDYGSNFDFIRNGQSHDILAFHVDYNQPLAAQEPKEVLYSWSAEIKSYVLR